MTVPSRLSSLLVRDGLVGVKRMEKAFQRQVIYGGSLDTILLEMNVLSEERLTQYLALSSGLPRRGPARPTLPARPLRFSVWSSSLPDSRQKRDSAARCCIGSWRQEKSPSAFPRILRAAPLEHARASPGGSRRG